MKKIRTVLLYALYTDKLSYYQDWIDAFNECEKLAVYNVNVASPVNNLKEIFSHIETDDLIILHHSMTADNLKFLHLIKHALLKRQGTLVSFIGNEVNLPILSMKAKLDIMKELSPEIIATQLLQEAGNWLYSDCKKTSVVSLPHALNPKIFFPQYTYLQKEIDVGARTHRYSVYLGDTDRNKIIDFFKNLSITTDLKIDLGEIHANERFNREGWANFLARCKATISTEAGSFYLDKDDELVRTMNAYFRQKSKFFVLPNESSFYRKLYQKVVPSVLRVFIRNKLSFYLREEDTLENEFNDDQNINEVFFEKRPRAPVYTKCISSRHFEAIGVQTVQVMFEGRYNDILYPNVHYLSLNKDFSNIDTILSFLSDQNKVARMTKETHQYISEHHTYTHRVKALLEHVH